MRTIPNALVALILTTLAAAAPVQANSVLSAGGLGEPSLEENARLRAMGGAGVAEHGASTFSMVNPASIAEARFLSLEATFLATRRDVSSVDYGDGSAHETSLPSIRLVVRLPGAFVLGGSYLIGTNAQFAISRAESAGAASILTINGTGGIDLVRATLARKVTRNLNAGIDCEILGGSYREEWARVFPEIARAVVRDTLEVSWNRLARFRLGLQYVRDRFAVGAAYETERRLSVTEEQRTDGAAVKVEGQSLRIPSGYAAGFNAPIGARSRVVGQYRRRNWNPDSFQSDLVTFRSEERYSLGFEREGRGAGSLFDKLPLRFGATFLRWPDLLPRAGESDISGGTSPVDEWAVSIGTGVITPDRGGAIDLSLEGGSRGKKEDVGVSETFFRAAVSLRVSDSTWR